MFSALLARCSLITTALIVLGLPGQLPAQDFRVYTSVTDMNSPVRSKPRTSLTVFHSGKVYDYIESAEETVIYEPAHGRFLVLSKRHDLATEITQDEVRRYLELATSHARELIGEWQREGETKHAAIQALEFQLLPEFEVEDNPKTKTLSLISPQLRYDVKYAEAPSSEIVQLYLKTADWTAQLNAVLHPHALLPAARMQLNEELRQRNVLPIEVELRLEGDLPVHLKAVHAWTWELLRHDRQMIDLRERQLRQPNRRVVPFQEFQRETLTASRKR